MKLRLYTLDEAGVPREVFDFQEWRSKTNGDGVTKIAEESVKEVVIVTSFLGHTYGPENPPVLWETYVFGGSKNNTKETCSGSRTDALDMHAKVLAMVKANS